MQHVRVKRLARQHTSAYVSIRQRLHLKHRMQHVRFKRQRLAHLPLLNFKNRLLKDRAPQQRLQPPAAEQESAEQEEQETGKEEGGGVAGGQGHGRDRGGVRWGQQQRQEEQ
jgi:hypothetical protein